MRRLLLALVVLAGCYVDFRGGPVAPTKHGFGSTGGQILGTSGGEYKTDRGSIGVGGVVFAQATNGALLVGGGVQLRSELTIKRLWYFLGGTDVLDYTKQFVWINAVTAGLGGITTESSGPTKLVDVFSGIGYSNLRKGRARWVTYGVGVIATRLWPSERDGAWFVGVGVYLGGGYDIDDRGPP